MKKYMILLLAIGFSIMSQAQLIKYGNWEINLDRDTKLLSIKNQGNVLLQDVYASASFAFDGTETLTTYKSSNAFAVGFSNEEASSCFGNGQRYSYIYRFGNGLVMTQTFEFYNNDNSFITQLSLSTDARTSTIKSNHLVPLATETSQAIMPNDRTNRMLWVPWDNDGFISYSANYLRTDMNSYNVTAIYHPADRYGIVTGAVDHDLWKNAIHVNATDYYKVNTLELMSGYADEHSHDSIQSEGRNTPHGTVKGTMIASSRFLFGCFDDWRVGMETYGKTCAMVNPRREWDGGTPYGWSSWGVMQTKISYDGIIDVANFLKDNVRIHGFHDEKGRIVLSLDAWWNDNLSTTQIKQFVAYCKENNMIPGLYYGPFCDFGGYANNDVPGTSGKYKYKDLWLKQNGHYKKIDGAYCLDPTHPGTKLFIANDMKRFKDWGIEYLKCDFMSNGAIEADSWYDQQCYTGIQAYNKGMTFLRKKAGDNIYLLLSIAPMFPAHYTHGRRISCDAWGSIDNTKYVMNNSSYGWWLNQVYFANDPDHLVMKTLDGKGNESEGVNRSRITSGVITGAFISGDNFSDKVDAGYPSLSRERALSLLTNEDINEIPRTCQAFRPVEGNASSSQNAENLMCYENDKYVYLAAINYGKTIFTTLNSNVTFERLGIDAGNVSEIKELWTGKTITPNTTGFTYDVPFSDARIYRITKKFATDGINDTQISEDQNIGIKVENHMIHINSGSSVIKQIRLFDVTGKNLTEQTGLQERSSHEWEIPVLAKGVNIIEVTTTTSKRTLKIVL